MEFIFRPSAAPTRAGLTADRIWKCLWFPLISVRFGSSVHRCHRGRKHDKSIATGGDRGRRFRRIGRRESSEEDTRESNPDRPYESPPVSTFALPGGNLGLDARSDCDANPQHSSESEEYDSHHGG